MFKRRDPRSYGRMASDMVYPPGGWRRATTYVLHRLRRLPDAPHRIGRGIGAGVLASFTPLFGLHFLLGGLLAFLARGNVLAGLLGTFAGNPITLPFIAGFSLTLGRSILDLPGAYGPQKIFGEFARAGEELWHNLLSAFGPRVAHWDNLADFFAQVFWPYLLGGLIIGLPVAIAAHYLTVPVIRAYHARRARVMAQRIEKLRTLRPPPGPPPGPPSGPPPDRGQ